MTNIEEIVNVVQKKHGKESITTFNADQVQDVEVISTQSLLLDSALGTGGFPKGRVVEIYGPESSGKAQPLSSQVLTPKGYVQMKDLEVGSRVCTPDGGESTVIGIYPQGMQDVYKVTLDDKSFTMCTLDHLWSVSTRDSDLENVMSTQQILDKGLGKHYRKFKIPQINPCKFNESEQLLDPWLLGLLLGDGSLRDSITLSCNDEQIVNRVRSILESQYDMTLSAKRNHCDYGLRWKGRMKKPNPVAQAIADLGLLNKKSYDKFIPKQYLINSIDARIEVFRGLIDSDGHVSGNSIQFVTTSKQLAKDFVFLARSLGCRCVHSSRRNSYTTKSGQKQSGAIAYYINCLLGDFSFKVATLDRKQVADKKSKMNNRFIESIEYSHKEHCQCIMIGHPDSLYITDNFTTTHNTTLTLHALAQVQKEDGVAAFIDVEHAFDPTYAAAIGVDVENLLFSQPDTGEEALEIVDTLLNTKKVALIVIDSVAALVPKAELDGEMGDSKMGLQARLMSQALRKITGIIGKSNCCVIFINQLREKIGVMFGNPETTTGGNALKYYSSVRLEIRRKSYIKDKEGAHIGTHAKIKVIKNKLAPPFRECEVTIMFGEGISLEHEILEAAVQLEIVNKSGSWFSYNDSKIGQGKEGVVSILKDNPELAEELYDEIVNQL